MFLKQSMNKKRAELKNISRHVTNFKYEFLLKFNCLFL